MESLSCCIAALEDCDDHEDTGKSLEHFVAVSLWTQCDDLCLGLTALHLHASSGGSSADDRIDVLKKLFLLQTSPLSSALSPSHDDLFSSDAARTAILLDDAYEAMAHTQQQQLPELDCQERIVMLTRTLRFYVHHHQQHQQSATPMLDVLVRLHRRHSSVANARESLSCIEKAVAIHAEALREEQHQQHHITSLRVMQYRALVTMGDTEQVRGVSFCVSSLFEYLFGACDICVTPALLSQAACVMCDAYTALAAFGDGDDGSPEEDRIAVLMFVAEARGKEGKLHEKVWSYDIAAQQQSCDSLQVSVLEKCLSILERKFGSKSYECVDALDQLAGGF